MKETFSGKVWPNGEFGITRLRRCKVTLQRRRTLTAEQMWKVSGIQVHGVREMLRYTSESGGESCEVSLEKDPLTGGPFGLSHRVNSHRRQRGSNGISRYSARLVRNAAYMLQEKYGRGRLSFLTYTVPTLELEQWEVLCCKWSEVVRVVMQRIRRHLVRAGLPDYVVSVTEIQEGRMSRYGVPGLHLHMLFVGRKEGESWKLLPSQVRCFWREALETVLGCSLPDSAWKACERIERVKKSAEGYLGKYMTKGSQALGLWRASFPTMKAPSSWSNLSQSLRLLVVRAVVPIRSRMAVWMMDMGDMGDKEYIAYYRKMEIVSTSGRTLTVGCSGRLQPDNRKGTIEYLRSRFLEEIAVSVD